MNKVILMGRLCADPEFRQTQSNTPVCHFRIAVNRPKSKDGNQEADFINCSAWRGTAEFVSRYFSKGSMIIVEGQLRNHDYTDRNGVKHFSMEVVADEVHFGETKNARNMEAAPQGQVPPPQYQQPPQQYGAAPQETFNQQQYSSAYSQQQYQQQPQFGTVPPPNGNPYTQR